MDIDLCLKNKPLTEYSITKIIAVELDDGCNINFNNIKPIRDTNEYGGYRVKITVNIENIKETFNLDIATGDIITPKEIIYKHKTMLNYKYIDIKAYNVETILAEKIETILSKAEFSSRLKDYYDVYLIYSMKDSCIDIDIFQKAIGNTLKKRNFNGDIVQILEIIRESEILKYRWNNYKKEFKYANEIEFEDIINCLTELINIITVVDV